MKFNLRNVLIVVVSTMIFAYLIVGRPHKPGEFVDHEYLGKITGVSYIPAGWTQDKKTVIRTEARILMLDGLWQNIPLNIDGYICFDEDGYGYFSYFLEEGKVTHLPQAILIRK